MELELKIFKNILLIGCGKMGGALLNYWNKGEEQFTIVDPFLEKAPEGVRLFDNRDPIADETFDVVIVAIKPQMIEAELPAYAPMLADGGYVLSIAAGMAIDSLKRATPAAPVIRVMPNLPAAIGKGTSTLVAGPDVQDRQREHALGMMERTGTVVEVENEDMLDRATAVAGSGPGYVFEIARAYVAAAEELGFAPEDARALVMGTLEGTIAMAQAQSDTALGELRDNVTSKGGTTAAGLKALNGEGGLSTLLHDTLKAAYDRAVELR